MLKMPVLSTARLRTKANLLTVRLPFTGTVLTKVVKLRPFPKVKEMTLVLGNKACAVTLTMGTCSICISLLSCYEYFCNIGALLICPAMMHPTSLLCMTIKSSGDSSDDDWKVTYAEQHFLAEAQSEG